MGKLWVSHGKKIWEISKVRKLRNERKDEKEIKRKEEGRERN